MSANEERGRADRGGTILTLSGCPFSGGIALNGPVQRDGQACLPLEHATSGNGNSLQYTSPVSPLISLPSLASLSGSGEEDVDSNSTKQTFPWDPASLPQIDPKETASNEGEHRHFNNVTLYFHYFVVGDAWMQG